MHVLAGRRVFPFDQAARASRLDLGRARARGRSVVRDGLAGAEPPVAQAAQPLRGCCDEGLAGSASRGEGRPAIRTRRAEAIASREGRRGAWIAQRAPLERTARSARLGRWGAGGSVGRERDRSDLRAGRERRRRCARVALAARARRRSLSSAVGSERARSRGQPLGFRPPAGVEPAAGESLH